MFKSFGSTKEVFVNQDEGMFVAFPITFDEDVLTLETETVGGRKYVLAGSVVKEGSVVRGITAESYDITYGPKAGRIVLEGYAWASKLTATALVSLSSLPKIIAMPYLYGSFKIIAIDGLKVTLEATEGFKFEDDIELSDIDATTLVPSSVTYLADNRIAITFAAAATGTLDAIDPTALINDSGATIKGLPATLTVALGTKRAVTLTVGSNGTATADKATAAEGEIVTLTITPSALYAVDEVKVNGVAIEDVSGAYTFVMPAVATAVSVTFELA